MDRGADSLELEHLTQTEELKMNHSYLLGKPNTRICCPEERIIMVLSHLALEEPQGLNSK